MRWRTRIAGASGALGANRAAFCSRLFVCVRGPSKDRFDDNYLPIKIEVINDPIVANSAAPDNRHSAKAFDIPIKRVSPHRT
jgi:hypothetical protein